MARVLVINDEPDLIWMCELVLQADGHEVRHVLAPQRPDQLAAAAEWGPDVILLDLVMPGLEGAQVVRMFRKMRGVHDVPIVVMSALADARDRAEELGVAGLIEKPFDPKTLLNAIHQAVGRGPTSDQPPSQARHGESRRQRLQR